MNEAKIRYPELKEGEILKSFLYPSRTGDRPISYDNNGKIILMDFIPENNKYTQGQYVKLRITKDMGNYYRASVLELLEPPKPTTPNKDNEQSIIIDNYKARMYIYGKKSTKRGITLYINQKDAKRIINPLLKYHMRSVNVTVTLNKE